MRSSDAPPSPQLKYPTEYRLASYTCGAPRIPAKTLAFFVTPGRDGLVSQSDATLPARQAPAPQLPETHPWRLSAIANARAGTRQRRGDEWHAHTIP